METRNGMMEENQQNPTSGLGTRLKTARESLHLSQRDAAIRLHLGPSMIQLIENEDFRRAPPPTFMRGYVRSYAKLLNLAITDDEINLALSQSGIDLTPKTTLTSVFQTTESREKTDRYVHMITMLILAVSLVLVGIWWKSHKTAPDTLPIVAQNPATQPTPPQQPTVATNATAPTVAVAPAPVAAPTVTTTPVAAAPTAAPNTEPAPVAQQSTTTPSAVATSPAAPTANVPPTENTAPPATEPPVVANTTTTPPAATNPATTPEAGALPTTPNVALPPVTGLANAAPVQPTPDATQATNSDDQPRKKRHRRSAEFDNRVSGMAMALPEPGL
jgi:cytoskeleton protein RodZ